MVSGNISLAFEYTDESINDALIFAGSPDNFMMIMIGWLLMAALMFFLRPSSMRNSTQGKPQGGNNQGPRDPPPTVS